MTAELWQELGLSESGDIEEEPIPSYSELLSALQTTIPFSLSINGKFAAQINLPPSFKGDSDAILSYLNEHQD